MKGAILEARKFFIRRIRNCSENIPEPLRGSVPCPASAHTNRQLDFFLPPITGGSSNSNWQGRGQSRKGFLQGLTTWKVSGQWSWRVYESLWVVTISSCHTVGTQRDNNHREKPFMRRLPEGVLSEQRDLLSGQKMMTIFRSSFNKSTAIYQMIM